MKKMSSLLKSKKGFTLVEIIVVLLILAILAAFSIPTMLGFVEDAKGKAYIAEARTVYIAAQVVATQETAIGTTTSAIVTKIRATTADPMKTLLGGDAAGTVPSVTVSAIGKVTGLAYSVGGYTVTITPGTGTVITKP